MPVFRSGLGQAPAWCELERFEILRLSPGDTTLPDTHGPEIQALDDFQHPAFLDRSDAIDVPLMAGDLVIGDARLIHGAWPNGTDRRRTLILPGIHCEANNSYAPVATSILTQGAT